MKARMPSRTQAGQEFASHHIALHRGPGESSTFPHETSERLAQTRSIIHWMAHSSRQTRNKALMRRLVLGWAPSRSRSFPFNSLKTTFNKRADIGAGMMD